MAVTDESYELFVVIIVIITIITSRPTTKIIKTLKQPVAFHFIQ
jgi:hypothetical protein